mmetsp:Transcript_8564/g.14444  ORF Transcript_8564/g.14444 Transcript_8564/m.14444 type:complete len:200 (+) Transcript_8564:29-628(+)
MHLIGLDSNPDLEELRRSQPSLLRDHQERPRVVDSGRDGRKGLAQGLDPMMVWVVDPVSIAEQSVHHLLRLRRHLCVHGLDEIGVADVNLPLAALDVNELLVLLEELHVEVIDSLQPASFGLKFYHPLQVLVGILAQVLSLLLVLQFIDKVLRVFLVSIDLSVCRVQIVIEFLLQLVVDVGLLQDLRVEVLEAALCACR